MKTSNAERRTSNVEVLKAPLRSTFSVRRSTFDVLPFLFRVAALLPLLAAPFAFAADNPYDLFGRAVAPFVQLLAAKNKSPNRSLTLSARIEEMTDLPPALAGARAELILQPPDKLRLRAPIFGEELTVCRRGEELWAFPGSKVSALLEAATAGKQLPPPDLKAKLPPLRLPFPEKQLIFLPALFQVRDGGAASIEGTPCRVVDLQLMPELARSLGSAGWAARLWLRPDATPARLGLSRQGFGLAVRLDEVRFGPALPKETWQPTEGQADDIRRISPAEFGELLQAIGGGK